MLLLLVLFVVQSLTSLPLALAAPATSNCLPGILGAILNDALSNDPQVRSYCSSRYPRPVTTKTTTFSTTSTKFTTFVATITTATATTTTTTTTTVSTVTITTTVTHGMRKRASTLGTTITIGSPSTTGTIATAKATTTTKIPLLASLTAFASSIVSSYCTCIQPSTSTVSTTTTVRVSTFVVSTSTSTVTNTITSTATTTSVTRITQTSTVSPTTTTTAAAAGPTACNSAQAQSCSTVPGCSCGVDTNGDIHCWAGASCSTTTQNVCTTDADCTKYGANYYCLYDSTNRCGAGTDRTICANQTECPNQPGGIVIRQLEKVFEAAEARRAKLARRSLVAVAAGNA